MLLVNRETATEIVELLIEARDDNTNNMKRQAYQKAVVMFVQSLVDQIEYLEEKVYPSSMERDE